MALVFYKLPRSVVYLFRMRKYDQGDIACVLMKSEKTCLFSGRNIDSSRQTNEFDHTGWICGRLQNCS